MLVTSILEKLHAFHPDARIELVVRKGNDDLFAEHPFLHKLHVWDKRKGKTKALFRLIKELRKTRYDHIINAQRFFSTGLMTVLARSRETVGYDKNPLSFLFTRRVKHVIGDPAAPLGEAPHEVDRLNALIEHLTDSTRPLPKLYPTAAAIQQAEQVMQDRLEDFGRYVCIAPASVWYTKQWPREKWVELIVRLPEDMQVFLIGAPGDLDLCSAIIGAAGRGELLTGDLSLLGSAALMRGAAMNYVNDSGPLHIASAMNAPVTAVFCSTVPAFGFGPLRANGRVVETNEKLGCRPCGLHGYKACPQGHFKCALGIEVGSTIP